MPLAASLFNPGLQLGIMYLFKNNHFYSATAFHVESSALTNVMNYPSFNQQGYSLLTRFVWRSFHDIDHKATFQAGLSLGFSTPERHLIGEEDVHDTFVNSSNFPTRVSNVIAISETVNNAKNRFKLTPEFIFAYRKFGLESQYFFQTISRRNNFSNVNSDGFYLTLRGVLLGADYKYDATSAQLANPTKKSLELVGDYNYSHFGEQSANSVTTTLNYYFNPYITARLNYTYTKVKDKRDISEFKSISQNAFQIRLMVLF